jgi:hypothetical protein
MPTEPAYHLAFPSGLPLAYILLDADDRRRIRRGDLHRLRMIPSASRPTRP